MSPTAKTLVCVPIVVEEVGRALADASEASTLGADLVEYRIDGLFNGELDEGVTGDLCRLLDETPLSCIVTCRSVSEGGRYEGSDWARLDLLEAIAKRKKPPRAPAYIDAEFASYRDSPGIARRLNELFGDSGRFSATGLILSTHDFDGRPAALSRRLLSMRNAGSARAIKVAFRARSLRDNLELFDLLRERDRPTIALGMGEFGLMSRVLAPKFGGMLTFASLRDESATAPGQPTIADLLGLYRFKSINAGTRVYGVVGWPVSHSLGPFIHNAGFEAVGHDGVYLPLPIAAGENGHAAYESLKATLPALIEYRGLGFSGASVTIPHKTGLLRLAGEMGWEIDEASRAIGAANTLVVERGAEGGVEGVRLLNTDAGAIGDCMEEAVGRFEGLRCAVIGAGGAARAAAWAMASRGASVGVYARKPEKAEELARSIEGAAGEITAHALDAFADGGHSDALINCTPVGMRGGPEPDATPVGQAALERMAKGAVCFDTVYTPARTPLIEAAEHAGLRTIDGASMFVRQASAQFEAWTGSPAPEGLFRRIVEERSSL